MIAAIIFGTKFPYLLDLLIIWIAIIAMVIGVAAGTLAMVGAGGHIFKWCFQAMTACWLCATGTFGLYRQLRVLKFPFMYWLDKAIAEGNDINTGFGEIVTLEELRDARQSLQ